VEEEGDARLVVVLVLPDVLIGYLLAALRV
jgi:hypothetical protein